MTDTVTLKPCPFCGGVAKFVDDPGVCDVPFGLVVHHSGDCFFDMSLCTDAKQIERWNTRASSTASSVGADALAHLESEARRFAGFYEPNSDMANTLNILGNKIAILAASTAQVDETERLPADVARLVIAAREVAYTDAPTSDEKSELDRAVEAFASRVPWEGE